MHDMGTLSERARYLKACLVWTNALSERTRLNALALAVVPRTKVAWKSFKKVLFNVWCHVILRYTMCFAIARQASHIHFQALNAFCSMQQRDFRSDYVPMHTILKVICKLLYSGHAWTSKPRQPKSTCAPRPICLARHSQQPTSTCAPGVTQTRIVLWEEEAVGGVFFLSATPHVLCFFCLQPHVLCVFFCMQPHVLCVYMGTT